MWNKDADSSQTQSAVVGQTMTIKGSIQSSEDLYIDGDVEGSLDLTGCRLTIGPHGKVAANALARELIVIGQMKGDVEVTSKVAIRTNGRLIGDIKAAGIVIDDDAYFKGKIDIIMNRSAANPEG
jgi:cytoskeletal protein CcmA (bactofilin family)